MRTVALALLALPLAAAAGSLDEKRLDLQVPDIPALTAVGASATNVSRPGTVRELATALITGVGFDGTVQSGVALELAPLRLALGDEPAEGGLQVLSPLRVSLASRTTAGTGAGAGATQLSTAFRWTALSYDPVADPMLSGCIAHLPRRPAPLAEGAIAELPGEQETLPPKPALSEPPTTGELLAVDRHAYARLRNLESRVAALEVDTKSPDVQRCRDTFRQAHLGTGALELAFAHVVQATGTPYVSAFSASRTSLWAGGSLALWSERLAALEARRPQFKQMQMKHKEWSELVDALARMNGLTVELIGYIRVDFERTPDVYPRQTNILGAARLPLIWDGFSVFGEIGFKATDLARVTPTGGGATYPVGIGADLRVSEGTWVGLYAGTELGNEAAVKILSNVKWAMGEKRPYGY